MTRIEGSAGSTHVVATRETGLQGRTERRHGGQDSVPPPAPAPQDQADMPTLAPPVQTDGTDLLLAALAMRMKNNDEQTKSSTEEVQFKADVQRTQNDEINKQMAHQLKEMDKSKTLGTFLKAMQWIGVGLAVAVAAVTLNPVAIMGAVMAVSMAVLSETGTMDKMTNAMADSLEKDGMSDTEAKKWAMGLTTGITIAVSLVGLGAGVASSATNAAEAMAQMATKIAAIVPKLAIGVKVAEALVTGTQGGVAIGKAVYDKNISDTTAEIDETKAYVAKLKAAMDDEIDRIQQMVQNAQETVSNAMKAMSGVSHTNSNVIRHMA